MGTFDLPAPIARINAISSSKGLSQRDFFRTHYFSNPWSLPSSTTTLGEGQVGGMVCPMSTTEIAYQSIVNFVDSNPTPFSPEKLDGDVAPSWTLDLNSTQDFLDTVLPSEEAILEEMMGFERPWNDLHHRSYFLPHLRGVESSLSIPSTSDVHEVLNPLAPS